MHIYEKVYYTLRAGKVEFRSLIVDNLHQASTCDWIIESLRRHWSWSLQSSVKKLRFLFFKIILIVFKIMFESHKIVFQAPCSCTYSRVRQCPYSQERHLPAPVSEPRPSCLACPAPRSWAGGPSLLLPASIWECCIVPVRNFYWWQSTLAQRRNTQSFNLRSSSQLYSDLDCQGPSVRASWTGSPWNSLYLGLCWSALFWHPCLPASDICKYRQQLGRVHPRLLAHSFQRVCPWIQPCFRSFVS